MLDPKLNDKVSNTLSTLAVAQLLADNLKNLIKINKTGSPILFDISGALDLTINLLKIAGVSYEELVDTITDMINGKVGNASLSAIDETARKTIATALNVMVNCANSPIIGNDMLDKHDLNGEEVTPPGVEINLSVLDIFNKFSKINPTDLRGTYYYGDVPSQVLTPQQRTIRPSDTWKSGDLDTFIWYTMNMVTSPGPENRKTYWDDRNTKYKNKVQESTPASYSIEEKLPEFNKLFRIEFDDATNNFHIYLDPDRYQNKNGVFNKTIYTFNNDYLKNLRLLYPKPIIASMLDTIANGSISLSVNGGMSLSLAESTINAKITEIIEKVIEGDDTNVEDCFFTFTNNEYNELIRQADLRRKGIKTSTGDTVSSDMFDTDTLMAYLDEISPNATFQEQKTIIKNAITQITGGQAINDIVDYPAFKADTSINYDNWDADSYQNKAIQLLKATIQKIVESVLTPKVVMIYLINYSFANGKMPKTPMDFVILFAGLLKNIIISILDTIINMLFELAMDKIKKLIAVYISQIALERLRKYTDVVKALASNCSITLNVPSLSSTMAGQIDDVRHADILETKDTPGDTNC